MDSRYDRVPVGGRVISQCGGFVERNINGDIGQWKLDGSGVKALLATIDAIREARLLPAIDIHDRVRERLSCFFMSSTFARQRTDMFCELATNGGVPFFQSHLDAARKRDGSYCFNIMHMAGLTQRFPLCFGGDAPFHKKASLLLLTMEIALNQLGHRATSMTPPPADYRIPQILEGLGILKFNQKLADGIDTSHLFAAADPEVRAVRTMTVEAAGQIRDAYQRHYGRNIGTGELDGMLYLLSRDRRLMSRATIKPHMLVSTLQF